MIIIGYISVPLTLHDPSTGRSYTRATHFFITTQLQDEILLGRPAMANIISSLDLLSNRVVFNAAYPHDGRDQLSDWKFRLTKGATIPAGHARVLRVSYDSTLDTTAGASDILCEPITLYRKNGAAVELNISNHLIAAVPDGSRSHHHIRVYNAGACVITLRPFMAIAMGNHVTAPVSSNTHPAVYDPGEAKSTHALPDGKLAFDDYYSAAKAVGHENINECKQAYEHRFSSQHMKHARVRAREPLSVSARAPPLQARPRTEGKEHKEGVKTLQISISDSSDARQVNAVTLTDPGPIAVDTSPASSSSAASAVLSRPPVTRADLRRRAQRDPESPLSAAVNPKPNTETAEQRAKRKKLDRIRADIAEELSRRAKQYVAGYVEATTDLTRDAPLSCQRVSSITAKPFEQRSPTECGYLDGAAITAEERQQFFESFDASPKLSAAEREKLEQLLLRHRQVFGKVRVGDPAPRAVGVQFAIHTGDAVPLKQAPYRHSPDKEAIINEEVQHLLKLKLIEPSFSPWGSPVLLVQKKDGSQRMCIDYRKLNALTKKDAYPLPLIEDCLERCKRARYMTIIDLADAYHHIEMEPESEAATAFVTKDGLFHWKVMPYGATGCPGAFQRYVDRVLRGLVGDICTAYFDDIVIYTDGDFNQHLIDLERVLTRLREYGLRAKMKKCHFAYDEVIFVGHLVRNGTIMPDPSKLDAIKKIPIPQDVTHLKSFLGLVNYYRKFVDQFARIALPLYALTKKGVPYEWGGAQDAAFNRLKKELISAKCLYAPDFQRQFILQTDASDDGIGAVLTQRFEDGEHPVAYISRQLLPAEVNYSATEQEALAVVWSIKTFEHYLIDKPFVVVTDHHSLQWMPQKQSVNKRLARWALYLSELTFTVEYRKGKDNANADGLSRNPIPSNSMDDSVDIPAALPLHATTYDSSSSVSTQPAPARKKPKKITLSKHATPTTVSKLAAAINAVRVVPRVTAPRYTLGHRENHDRYVQRVTRNAAATSTPSPRTAPVSTSAASADEKVGVKKGDYPDFIVQDREDIEPLVRAQRADPKLEDLIALLENNEVPNRYSAAAIAHLQQRARHFIIDPDTRALYCTQQPENYGRSEFHTFQRRLVLPKVYQEQVMAIYHDSPFAGHRGISTTYTRIARRYEWEGMYRDIANYVGRCVACLRSKTKKFTAARQQPRMVTPSTPFEVIAMDYINLSKASHEFKYILVIVDMFTGWAITCPTMNVDSSTTARVLIDMVICQHGCPRRILTDNAFDTEMLRVLYDGFDIRQILISPHHPQTNGMVERLNGSLKQILRVFVDEHADQWVFYLQPSTFAYNTSSKATSGLSPFFALYGREAHLPGELFRGETDDYVYEDAVTPNTITAVSALRQRLTLAHMYVKTKLNALNLKNVQELQTRATYPTYKEGDVVYLRNQRSASMKTGGFVSRYIGPYYIRARIGQTNYEISRPNNPSHFELVHVDDLKRVAPPPAAAASHAPAATPAHAAAPDGTPAVDAGVPVPVNVGYDTRSNQVPIPDIDDLPPLIPVSHAPAAASAAHTAEASEPGPPRIATQHHPTRSRRRKALQEAIAAQPPAAPAPLPSIQLPTPVSPDTLKPILADAPAAEVSSDIRRSSRRPALAGRPNYNEQAQEQLQMLQHYADLGHRQNKDIRAPRMPHPSSLHPAKYSVSMINFCNSIHAPATRAWEATQEASASARRG